jgi:hypothetical protein
MAGMASVGMNLSSSASEGVTVTPRVGMSLKQKTTEKQAKEGYLSGDVGASMAYNSRQGVQGFNINTSMSSNQIKSVTRNGKSKSYRRSGTMVGGSGNISFANQTFTPTKRVRYHNTGFTFDASLGADIWGIDGELGVTAFGHQQRIDAKETQERAYGYEFSKNATYNDILDFNRENDRTVSKQTLVLPTVNYTYDIYSIQGQGIGGQFRPYKSQVGYVFDQYIKDSGASGQLGVEIEGATGFHAGVDLKVTDIDNHTGVWDTYALNKFVNSTNNPIDYEETYFKSTGDLSVDDDIELFENQLGGESAIALDITPNGERTWGKEAVAVFRKKEEDANTAETNFNYTNIDIPNKIKRQNREKRNQAILKVSKQEALDDPMISAASQLKNHQTNGIKITNAEGSRYIYGDVALNLSKKEATFATEGVPNFYEGTVTYNQGIDDNIHFNDAGNDKYVNVVETPQYAHSFLLTSVLSSDYEDLTGNGPTDDDLGTYTRIHYDAFSNNNYTWRVPYNRGNASYNPGFYTLVNDQKGSYIEGVKELKYATQIETKTHVAFIDLEEREDGKGVDGESQMRINTIRLYSKPEAIKANLLDDIAGNDQDIDPIKTAHFEYDYELMPNTPNSDAVDQGKLTLKKVYFTYRGSQMGKYTPYEFNYGKLDENGEIDPEYNPEYQVKSYDIWGNYKPLYDVLPPDLSDHEAHNPLTASEYPFVQQENKDLQDIYASAWTLTSIDLPSGGNIELEYESDEYQYVQDKRAMQMFKVVGVLDAYDSGSINNLMTQGNYGKLYGNSQEAKFIVVALNGEENSTENIAYLQDNGFDEKYLGEHANEPIYFNFLTNMVKGSDSKFDYVRGYFEIDHSTDHKIFSENNILYAAIPMKHVGMEGDNSTKVNPISKASWFFGRQNFNRFVYGAGDDTPEDASLNEMIESLEGAFVGMLDIFSAPNTPLRNRERVAQRFNPEKSWIRLQNPNKRKLGGGLRVKRIQMHDNWDVMTSHENPADQKYYKQFYGQEYNYDLEDGSGSSGVATWESNENKENPFVKPFYNHPEKLMAPTFVEKPFGKSFFPAPAVTYSRVTVSNLKRINENNQAILKKHATGKVVSEFFTFKDFPTITDYTQMDDPSNFKTNSGNLANSLLSSITGISRSRTELALSQGFVVVTNDMNAKEKSQRVYDEFDNMISGVDYIYNVDEDTGQLNNRLPVIDNDGTVSEKLIGMQYDVVTDFRESYNRTAIHGVHVNVAGFVIGIIPIIIPLGLYNGQNIQSTLHSTTTTKVIHKTGVLKEKIAYDLGATVKTKNLAWDALSGQVLLTETVNEYSDNYYNFTYPAHWAYKNMGQAVHNLGLQVEIGAAPLEPGNNINNPNVFGDYDHENPEDASDNSPEGGAWYEVIGFTGNLRDFFSEGDEVILTPKPRKTNNTVSGAPPEGENRFWINQIDQNRFILINREGIVTTACGDNEQRMMKVVRSHRSNQQSASMASITSKTNPLTYNESTETYEGDVLTAFNYFDAMHDNPQIVNASAVEYKDFWLPHKEGRFQSNYPEASLLTSANTVAYPYKYPVNPFVNNIIGEWRAVKSYAYLTNRTDTGNLRNSGYFEDFIPFYIYNGPSDSFVRDDANNVLNKWTFASEVTRYNPKGAELENADALGRHSAAQYGYNYTLPVAVASNSSYNEIGFDGMEDYDFDNVSNAHFKFRVSNSNSQTTNVTRSSDEAHTGRYSLKVEGNSSATIKSRCEDDREDELGLIADCSPPIEVEITDPPGCTSDLASASISFPNIETGTEITYEFVFETPSGAQFTGKQLNINGNIHTSSSGYGSFDIGNSGNVIISGQLFDLCYTHINSENLNHSIIFMINDNIVAEIKLSYCDDGGCS